MFSIVIPTRNRPGTLRRCVHSISQQTSRNFEVIIIDDGSSPANVQEYRAIVGDCGLDANLHSLPPLPSGHGPSFTRNYGVAQAGRDYVAFLDDDDEWTDPAHLDRAQAEILLQAKPVDLYLSNQVARNPDGSFVKGPIWIEDMDQALSLSGTARQQVVAVRAEDLVKSNGFCHLNTTIVRHACFTRIGGFDETLRYEEDRDFYLRAVDAAGCILYNPATIALYHVPQASISPSLSLAISATEKLNTQLYLLDKAITTAANPAIVQRSIAHKSNTLRKLSRLKLHQGDIPSAYALAVRAMAARPSAKWLAYLAWVSVLRLTSPFRRQRPEGGPD